jgi:hypothetical protein
MLNRDQMLHQKIALPSRVVRASAALFLMAVCGFEVPVSGAEASTSSTPGPAPSAGTAAMATFLRDWEQQLGAKNPFADTGRVRLLREQLTRETNAMARVNMMAELAKQLLNLGQVEESLAVVTNLLRQAESWGVALRRADRAWIRQQEGLAWMRLGERENCVAHHTVDSCLAPIRQGGWHVERRGAEAARAIFLELAQRDTNDITSRWLLNITSMTLGEYPERVPPALLIPPGAFASDYALPRIRHVAAGAGLS